MIAIDKFYYCKVCGLRQADPPWGEKGDTPNYEICSCCGVEFGNEDYSKESTVAYREKWIKGGAKWFEESQKPNDWDLNKQLSEIPDMW